MNIDSIIYLSNILNKDFFDEKQFNKFIRTKGMQQFISHEKNIDGKTNVKIIKKELKKVVLDEYYLDKYGFYMIKGNIEKFNMDIEYIINNKKTIIDKVLKEVYKIIPRHMKVNTNIYLYVGGDDGGFTINRKKVFINYGKYIGQKEEFIKILSHELYHSRKLYLKNRIILSVKTRPKNSKIRYGLMGKIIEEGMASLTQHGGFLKTDDPTGTLTKKNMLFIKEQFDLLNNIILDIKKGNIRHKDIKRLNIYAVGYHIISTIYNIDGVLELDDWTVKLEYKDIIKKYIEICKRKNISSGFIEEVEEWLCD